MHDSISVGFRANFLIAWRRVWGGGVDAADAVGTATWVRGREKRVVYERRMECTCGLAVNLFEPRQEGRREKVVGREVNLPWEGLLVDRFGAKGRVREPDVCVHHRLRPLLVVVRARYMTLESNICMRWGD